MRRWIDNNLCHYLLFWQWASRAATYCIWFSLFVLSVQGKLIIFSLIVVEYNNIDKINLCLLVIYFILKAMTAKGPWDRRFAFTAPFMVRMSMVLLRALGKGGGNQDSFIHVILQVWIWHSIIPYSIATNCYKVMKVFHWKSIYFHLILGLSCCCWGNYWSD